MTPKTGLTSRLPYIVVALHLAFRVGILADLTTVSFEAFDRLNRELPPAYLPTDPGTKGHPSLHASAELWPWAVHQHLAWFFRCCRSTSCPWCICIKPVGPGCFWPWRPPPAFSWRKALVAIAFWRWQTGRKETPLCHIFGLQITTLERQGPEQTESDLTCWEGGGYEAGFVGIGR